MWGMMRTETEARLSLLSTGSLLLPSESHVPYILLYGGN